MGQTKGLSPVYTASLIGVCNPYMGPFVDLEASSSGVALATDVTLERLLASVNKLMCLQMPFRDKLLPTAFESASKWSFSRLHSATEFSHASLQKYALRHCLHGFLSVS